jgi:hypothetical protein
MLPTNKPPAQRISIYLEEPYQGFGKQVGELLQIQIEMKRIQLTLVRIFIGVGIGVIIVNIVLALLLILLPFFLPVIISQLIR